MGFYGTLKMIFYKVSRVFFFFWFFFLLVFPPSSPPPVSPPTNILPISHDFNAGLACVALIISYAPLTADCAATAEDERQ